MLGVDHIDEDVICEGILTLDDEEQDVPAVVAVGGAIQNHMYEHLDVEDGEFLGVDNGMLGFVGVKRGVMETGLLDITLLLGLTSSRTIDR